MSDVSQVVQDVIAGQPARVVDGVNALLDKRAQEVVRAKYFEPAESEEEEKEEGESAEGETSDEEAE